MGKLQQTHSVTWQRLTEDKRRASKSQPHPWHSARKERRVSRTAGAAPILLGTALPAPSALSSNSRALRQELLDAAVVLPLHGDTHAEFVAVPCICDRSRPHHAAQGRACSWEGCELVKHGKKHSFPLQTVGQATSSTASCSTDLELLPNFNPIPWQYVSTFSKKWNLWACKDPWSTEIKWGKQINGAGSNWSCW